MDSPKTKFQGKNHYSSEKIVTGCLKFRVPYVIFREIFFLSENHEKIWSPKFFRENREKITKKNSLRIIFKQFFFLMCYYKKKVDKTRDMCYYNNKKSGQNARHFEKSDVMYRCDRQPWSKILNTIHPSLFVLRTTKFSCNSDETRTQTIFKTEIFAIQMQTTFFFHEIISIDTKKMSANISYIRSNFLSKKIFLSHSHTLKTPASVKYCKNFIEIVFRNFEIFDFSAEFKCKQLFFLPWKYFHRNEEKVKKEYCWFSHFDVIYRWSRVSEWGYHFVYIYFRP